MLKHLNLKARYNSDVDNPLKDFYIPCLKTSVRYKRATAYFTAASFFNAAQGITSLLDNYGCIQLVLSNELQNKEYAAISEGFNLKEKTNNDLVTIGETIKV